MGEFSFWHLILVFGVVLIFFGPSRLPGLGNSLGKAIKGFKEGIKGVTEDPTEKEAQAARDALPNSDKNSSGDKEKSKNTSNS